MEVAESAKSRLLSAQVQRHAIDPPEEVGPDLAQEEQLLLAELARLEGQELRHYDAMAIDPLRAVRMQRRSQLVHRLEDVWARMCRSLAGARYVARRRGAQASWPDVIRADTGTIAVSLVEAARVENRGQNDNDARLVAFAYLADRDEVVVREFDNDPVRDAVRRFEAEVPTDRGAEHRAETWSQRLVPTLRTLARTVGPVQRIVLSPPVAGRRLPWHVALERAGWGERPGGVLPVLTLPSLAVLTGSGPQTGTRWHAVVNAAKLTDSDVPDDIGEAISVTMRVEAGPASGPPLVIGNPTADLPAAEAEADAVGRVLAVTPLLGPRATVERVRADFADASVVHVAAHAAVVQNDPLRSYLRLADGVLTVDDLIGDHLRNRLVVLSSCEGARGELIPGGEVLGLAHALLRGGVRAVVAGLWRVDDVATAFLMAALHEELAEDPRVDVALAEAIHRTRSQPQWRPPYYWAGFVALTGALA